MQELQGSWPALQRIALALVEKEEVGLHGGREEVSTEPDEGKVSKVGKVAGEISVVGYTFLRERERKNVRVDVGGCHLPGEHEYDGEKSVYR